MKVKIIYLAWLASALLMINGPVYGDEIPVQDDMMNDVPFFNTSGTIDSTPVYTDTVQEMSIESDSLKRCLAQQMRDLQAKVLSMNVERARLEQDLLLLRISSVQRQLAELEGTTSEATNPAPGYGR